MDVRKVACVDESYTFRVPTRRSEMWEKRVGNDFARADHFGLSGMQIKPVDGMIER